MRKGDALNRVGLIVKLLDRHAILKGMDGDILLQIVLRIVALIDKGDYGRVKFVLNGKHAPMVAPRPPNARAKH